MNRKKEEQAIITRLIIDARARKGVGSYNFFLVAKPIYWGKIKQMGQGLWGKFEL